VGAVATALHYGTATLHETSPRLFSPARDPKNDNGAIASSHGEHEHRYESRLALSSVGSLATLPPGSSEN
jgi:hypothetical protein